MPRDTQKNDTQHSNVKCDFQHKGHNYNTEKLVSLGQKTLCWVLFILSVMKPSRILSVLGIARLYWAVLGSAGKCWAMLVSAGQCREVLGSPGQCWAVLGYAVLYWNRLEW